jgi:hypothetical protein
VWGQIRKAAGSQAEVRCNLVGNREPQKPSALGRDMKRQHLKVTQNETEKEVGICGNPGTRQ